MSDIDKDIERVKELHSTIYEGGDYIYLNKNDKQALGNALKELETRSVQVSVQVQDLETWKKIAEKLADILSLKPDEKSAKNYCNGEWSCLSKKKMTCKQCIIDWARKEVENDEI